MGLNSDISGQCKIVCSSTSRAGSLFSSLNWVFSCSAVSNSMDYSQSGSSAHGISQARIPEGVTISSSRESSRPRDQTHVSCITDSLPLSHWGSPISKFPPSKIIIIIIIIKVTSKTTFKENIKTVRICFHTQMTVGTGVLLSSPGCPE